MQMQLRLFICNFLHFLAKTKVRGILRTLCSQGVSFGSADCSNRKELLVDA